MVLKLNIHIYLHTACKSNLIIGTWQYTKNINIKMKIPFDQAEGPLDEITLKINYKEEKQCLKAQENNGYLYECKHGNSRLCNHLKLRYITLFFNKILSVLMFSNKNILIKIFFFLAIRLMLCIYPNCYMFKFFFKHK